MPTTRTTEGTRKRPGMLGVLKQAASDFGDDAALSYAAAVAFYSSLSLAPLVLLFLWATHFLGEDTQRQMMDQIQAVVGPGAGNAIKDIVTAAHEGPQANTLAGVIGIVTLVVSATGVFGQLQSALNVIWDVKPKPIGAGVDRTRWQIARAWVWSLIRQRLLSLGMVLTLGFLMLVSMMASAVLNGAIASLFGGSEAVVWEVVNEAVGLIVFAALFTLMFRYLPDVRIPWWAAWGGGAVTAVLFVLGRFALGLYLGRGTVGSGYGAAGSLVAMLVWVYYACVIVFVGAEVTQAWAAAHGVKIEPTEHAERVKRDPSGEGKQVRTA